MPENFKQIIGPNTINSNIRKAYIWVLPKSGTIFTSIFMNTYGSLLLNKKITEADLEYKVPEKNLFGKTEFIVEHSDCPGYPQLENNKYILNMWEAITYDNPSWGGDEQRKKNLAIPMYKSIKMGTENNLNVFERTKIVFIFRNPLDQFYSYYKFLNMDKVTTLEEFIFKVALDDYIKVFYSFYFVSKIFPNMILLVPYEQLIENKAETLKRIIDHLGIKYNEKAFQEAKQLTSKDNLKALERKSGHSLRHTSGQHIRDGEIGKWQSKMSPELVLSIEERFNQFGLSLTMFDIGTITKPEFKFLLANTIRLKPR